MARKIETRTAVERADLLAFVRERRRMILLTRRANGGPQLSPVTGGVDAEGRIIISTYPGRAKTVNIERDPAVSLCVISDNWNDAWVQIDGIAEVVHMPDSLEPLVDYYRALSGEHPDWDEYRDAMRTQGKSLIRITPERWGPIATGGFPADVAARLDG